MNEYRVIANEPLDIGDTHYDVGDVLTLHANDCGPLLVLGKVRLETTPEPPAKRKRGRPRKQKPEEANTYQRRDLRADE